ncbi:MAG: hypothetical protein U9R74_18830 [Pseudomonadota bacterium]|nr:hypothetical protein [Pseudomonadota bacterium]
MSDFPVAALCALAVIGCATRQPVDPAVCPIPEASVDTAPVLAVRYNDDGYINDWDVGVNWGNAGRGGAALRKPGYVQVIHRGRGETHGSTISAGVAADSASVGAGQTSENHPPPAPGETPEETVRRAWKQFCDAGVELARKDWERIEAAGGVNALPEDLARDCTPPK